MRQQSIPSFIQTVAIAVSSHPSTIICTFRRRTTTSFAITLPQFLRCSSQLWPWSLISVPTISTTTPVGWNGPLAFACTTGADAASTTAGVGAGAGGGTFAGATAPWGGCTFAGAAVASWGGFFFCDNLLCFCKDAATMGRGRSCGCQGHVRRKCSKNSMALRGGGGGGTKDIAQIPPLFGIGAPGTNQVGRSG
jgi:hypothetical protein